MAHHSQTQDETDNVSYKTKEVNIYESKLI